MQKKKTTRRKVKPGSKPKQEVEVFEQRGLRQETREKILTVLDGLSMYFFSLVGVVMSKYIPLLREGTKIEISISWSQMLVSCVVALLVLTGLEQVGSPSKAGKRKNFLRRAITALSLGAFWFNMIGG